MSTVASQIDHQRTSASTEMPTDGRVSALAEVDALAETSTAADGRPDLSVIVVTHNRTDLALTTLRSAREAVRDIDVEWIVVDSGSSEDTPGAIESAHTDVRVLRENNVGFAAANNRGLPHARGRYVLLLNPDIEIAEGTFDALVEALDARDDVGLASVLQRAPDGSLQYSIRRFPSAWSAFGEALLGSSWTPLRRWREEEPRPLRYQTEVSADWLVGAFLIARARAIRDVGPLDERFFLYSEETDWCYRFRQAGWKVSHLPVMAVTHHTGHEPRPDLSAQLSYAKILFARKHYGRASAGAIQAALALRHALRTAGARLLSVVQPRWTARAAAEQHALAVVLGRARPPFERRCAAK